MTGPKPREKGNTLPQSTLHLDDPPEIHPPKSWGARSTQSGTLGRNFARAQRLALGITAPDDADAGKRS